MCSSDLQNYIAIYRIFINRTVGQESVATLICATSFAMTPALHPAIGAQETLIAFVPTTTEASTVRLISVTVVMMPVPQAAQEAPTSGNATVLYVLKLLPCPQKYHIRFAFDLN